MPLRPPAGVGIGRPGDAADPSPSIRGGQSCFPCRKFDAAAVRRARAVSCACPSRQGNVLDPPADLEGAGGMELPRWRPVVHAKVLNNAPSDPRAESTRVGGSRTAPRRPPAQWQSVRYQGHRGQPLNGEQQHRRFSMRHAPDRPTAYGPCHRASGRRGPGGLSIPPTTSGRSAIHLTDTSPSERSTEAWPSVLERRRAFREMAAVLTTAPGQLAWVNGSRAADTVCQVNSRAPRHLLAGRAFRQICSTRLR